MKICDYHGCANPIADNQPRTGKQFCAKHDAEFLDIFQREPFKPQDALRWWVESEGGAEKWAKEMAEGLAKELYAEDDE